MRSGGGTIDFVREDDLVENWSHLESETSTHGIVNINPDDIGGNEVGSELNTFETAAKRFCERFGKCAVLPVPGISSINACLPHKRAINAHPIASRFLTSLCTLSHMRGNSAWTESGGAFVSEKPLRCVVQTDMSRIGCNCQN